MKQDVILSRIGEACADFTVLYCLVTHEEYLFAAWYDPAHRITVGCRAPQKDKWITFQPEGFWINERNRYSNITDYDSHNYLTMAIDAEGYIHLSGNMHVDPLIYYRSQKPLDICSIKPVLSMVGEREKRTTYPLFFKGRDGQLLFRYRDGCSGNGDDIYNYWNAQNQTWQRLLETPLLNGEGERNGYARPPVAGPDGYWHMVWMWRETPHCETNNNLSYARSRDLLHWETSAGKPLTLPISRSVGEIVDPAAPQEGLINMVQEVGFDNQGRPVLIFHRYDAQGHSQAWLARPDGNGAWLKTQISLWDFRWDFRGPGSIPPDVILSAPRPVGHARLEVEWQAVNAGQGVWVIDEETLQVIARKAVSGTLYNNQRQTRQHIHPDAEVQLIAALDSDGHEQRRYWLRWEALPIFRDVAHSVEVGATRLELIDTGME